VLPRVVERLLELLRLEVLVDAGIAGVSACSNFSDERALLLPRVTLEVERHAGLEVGCGDALRLAGSGS
jgi:hypothetical protein